MARVSANPSAVERAYALVADAIVTGELGAGSLITEGETAERLGVSRTPVREAFLLLEARGLLQLFPKRGAIVTAIHDDETAELLEVRIMLETAAVRAIGDRAQAARETRSELEGLLIDQQRAIATADALAFARADHAFHSRIVRGSRNRVIDRFYEQLGPRLERLTHRVVMRDGTALDRLLAEHGALARHAASADVTAFEAALREHVRLGHGI